MVDEIFDTSSDAVNMSCKCVFKETSAQTDIVWENINALFKLQSTTIKEPISGAVVNNPQNRDSLQSNLVGDDAKIKMVDQYARPPETNNSIGGDILNQQNNMCDGGCGHTQLKEFKICSCIACKSNIRFSAVNIDKSTKHISSSTTSSSSSAFDDSPPIPSAKLKLFPSERYKQMKQAQKEHFENDPRISKTLKKIYETAKTLRSQTSSGSSDYQCQLSDPLRFCNVLSCDDELLQPDLYTFSDEVLLFGLRSPDEVQYSSYLLRTESSQDTLESNGGYHGMHDALLRSKLMCTNSEDSSCNSFLNTRVSDLERCLLKDIENSGSDPTVLSSVFSTSSMERKINEIQLDDLK